MAQSIPVVMNPLFANEEECGMYLPPDVCQGVVSQINQKFQSLQQLLVSLRDKLETYQQLMEANNAQLAGTGADLDAVRAELAASQAAVADARTQKEALDRQIAEQIAQQGVADQTLQQLRNEAAAREDQAKRVQSELTAEKEQLKKDYEALIQDKESVAKTLGDLQTKMAAVLGTINTNLGTLQGNGQAIVDTYAVQFPEPQPQPQTQPQPNAMVSEVYPNFAEVFGASFDGPVVPGTSMISQNRTQFKDRIALAFQKRQYPVKIDNFTIPEYLDWYFEMNREGIDEFPDIVNDYNEQWETKSGRGS